MVAISKSATFPTINAIDQYWKDNQELQRGHLGCSQIGEECERMLWYSFRWCRQPDFNGRILRLFKYGHEAENTLIEYLRQIGVHVDSIDPTTGKQFTVSFVGGHFKGSVDGVVSELPEAPVTKHLLECKTSSDKYFKEMQKNGCEKSKPVHYAQQQIYMYGLDLTRSFYFVINKNDHELYSERIKIDKTFAGELLEKATRIITASEPPKKISNDPSWFKCKFCDYNDVCHGDAIVETNCRTCAHSTPILNGDAEWTCNKYENDKIPLDFQRKGCDKHEFINGLSTIVNDTFSALKKTSGQW